MTKQKKKKGTSSRFRKISHPRVAKVQSDRDLVDSGLRALVDALGYSGAVRFLRHFSKGEGDYLLIQEKLFKGMELEQIYKKAKDYHQQSK